MSKFDDLMEKIGDVKIDLSKVNKIKSDEKLAREEALERLRFLEKISNVKVTDNYKEGFLQGYYEAKFPV